MVAGIQNTDIYDRLYSRRPSQETLRSIALFATAHFSTKFLCKNLECSSPQHSFLWCVGICTAGIVSAKITQFMLTRQREQNDLAHRKRIEGIEERFRVVKGRVD